MVNINNLVLKYFQEFEKAFKLRLERKFPEAIAEYEAISGKSKEDCLLEAVRPDIDDAVRLEDPAVQIRAMKEAYIGDALRASGKPDEAKGYFKVAVENAKDPFIRAIALEFKGIYETQFGDKKQAVKDHEESLKLYTEIGHLGKIARAHSVLGASYIGTQEYDNAEKHFKEALKLTQDIILGVMDSKEEYKIYSKDKAMANRADALQRNGENLTLWGQYMLTQRMDDWAKLMFQDAIKSLKEAMEFSGELKDRGTLAVEHGRMAYTLSLLDDEAGCSDSYNHYMIGFNAGIIQPAAVRAMQLYINHIEEYLRRKAQDKLARSD